MHAPSMKALRRMVGRLLASRCTVRDERGDVPGWVMVTVMTAILVVAILTVFEPQIKHALSGVLGSINGR